MEKELVQKIQAALDSKRKSGVAAQQPEINIAIDAIARANGANRQEIIYRAIRLYLHAYLHTHLSGWVEPDQIR